MLHRRALLAALAAAPAAPALAAGASTLEDQPPLPGPLTRYRDLPVRRIDGEPQTLGRLLGPPRPTVVSFWATWCAPCALEARRLAQIRLRYPDEQLAIVGLNIDTHAPAANLDRFRQRAAMNYTQGLDGRAAYLEIAGQAQMALPRSYVFDGAGQPVAAFGRFFGERTLRALDEAVARAVAVQAIAQATPLRRGPPMRRATDRP